MKIQKIEFKNFRNFKEHGVINCSTDGKVTLILGENGDGKTTLHQLVQWVLYDQISFNKTATSSLPNLDFERNCNYGEEYDVMGRIEFLHRNTPYSATRINKYRKSIDGSELIKKDFELLMRDEEYNWKKVDRAQNAIEKILPSGLKEYFLFDGENMIADLRVKGHDSANKLRKSLYSMCSLDALESGISHIGKKDNRTTVVGKLFLKQKSDSGTDTNDLKFKMEQTEEAILKLDEEIKRQEDIIKEKEQIIIDVSEKIGKNKTKTEYEKERKKLKNDVEIFEKNIEMFKARFGEIICNDYAPLLVSKAVDLAKSKLKLKAEEHKIPLGIRKEFIDYLLHDASRCVCGNEITDVERACLRNILNELPPNSYKQVYTEFTSQADVRLKGYDKEITSKCILSIHNNELQINNTNTRIRDLDKAEKDSPDVQDLINARIRAENEKKEIEKTLTGYREKRHILKLRHDKLVKIFDKATTSLVINRIINRKIKIMEYVRERLEQTLSDESKIFSKTLQDNIQRLIDEMMTSRRKVAVSERFEVRITDSYDDESKSEGQFAMVSFAYIGGILQMLKDNKFVDNDEYPLILDGPFSKLDERQKNNVINTLPSFAPQVIIFSKDDITDYLGDNLGYVWTISSNEEKNIAVIKEGNLWK